jgi:hypothetical protein
MKTFEMKAFSKENRTILATVIIAPFLIIFVAFVVVAILSSGDMKGVIAFSSLILYFAVPVALFVFLIGLLYFIFWVLTKPSDQASIDEANIRYAAKYLANPVRAGEYAASKGISEEDVDRLVREGKLEAYSFKKQLYVSDT